MNNRSQNLTTHFTWYSLHTIHVY